FMVNKTHRILEATLELGNMEDIMNIRKLGRQLQLIGNFTSFSKDRERSNITRSQFAFDTETMNTSQRCNSKIGFVTNFIVNFLMMAIIVTLLTRLSYLQTFTNDSNLVFCFFDYIWSKE